MTDAPRIDRAETRVRATPEAVFAAWSDPGRLARWLPPEGARAEIEAFDFRPGGALRMVLHFLPGTDGKSGPSRDMVLARFDRIEPPGRLDLSVAFDSPDPAFAGTMRMLWRFEADGDATRVTVEAHDVPPGIRPEDHAAGLASSLAHLARFVEAPAADLPNRS